MRVTINQLIKTIYAIPSLSYWCYGLSDLAWENIKSPATRCDMTSFWRGRV